MAKKRLKAEDVDVPTTADDVPGGYPCELFSFNHEIGHVQFSIYAPIMPSPRPRVTSRGTFMPSDYRTHVKKLGVTLGHLRGLLDARGGWDPGARMNVSLFFEAFNPPKGDLDNLAKTILDAGQLHRGEPSGAELWTNDSQIDGLMVFRCRGAGTEHWSDTRVVVARVS
jgi:Holliday junction resolvase RusA-like endonuclease